jgi:hypothetical protein
MGIFATAETLPAGAAPYSILAAHLNDDTDLDIVVANAGGNSISVLVNTGAGAFFPHVEYLAGDAPGGVTACDVDGDNDLDIITGNLGSGDISLFENRGDATFEAAVPFTVASEPFAVACCDLDGINGPDVVTVDGINDTITVLLNDGTGSFGLPRVQSGGDGGFAITCCDVTANLVSNDVTLFVNEGNAVFADPPTVLPIGRNPSSVVCGDLQEDGDLDVIVAFRSGVKAVFNVCATGDFNADGEVDLLDFAEFELCFTGPDGGPIDPFCEPGDMDRDGDIDCTDWDLFRQAWTSADLPPPLPSCPEDIPTVSQWGMAVMGLLFTATGSIAARDTRQI